MTKDRITWIDIARGIGILLVLYGHGLNGDSYRYLIYSFHMPLFFFLSGIVYHHRKQENFLHFLKKNIKGILIPYFIFAILSYLLWVLNFGVEKITAEQIINHAYGVVYGNGNNGYLFFNVVLWFLPCLFITKVAFELVTRVSEKKLFIVAALLLFSIFGYLFAVFYPGIKLPFGIETAVTTTVFFGAGYLLNRYRNLLNPFIANHTLILLLVSLILTITAAQINYNIYELQIDLRLNRLNNYFLFYIGALSGIFSTIVLSIMIKKNKALEYIGKKSLILFVWHIIVFSYVSDVLRTVISENAISELRNIYLAPLYTIVAIFVILCMGMVVKRVQHSFAKATNNVKVD